MSFAFLVNARAASLQDGYLDNCRCSGYLFPPHRSTSKLRQSLAARPAPYVLADNGYFDDIGRIASELRKRYGTDGIRLAAITEARHLASKAGKTNMLPVQQAVRPDGLIGPEDITLACWLRVGVLEPDLRRRRREISRRNEVIAAATAKVAQNLPDQEVFAVASAHDYDSAKDAGRAMATAGVKNVAVGFGAFMADPSWMDSVKVNGRIRRLKAALPARYLRVGLVARGFFDGMADIAGAVPRRFHYLGLGAPIMLPLAALVPPRAVEVTLDATSPIKDAVDGTLYVNYPTALKVRTWNVAERLSVGSNNATSSNVSQSWDCPCTFCQSFLLQWPLDTVAARRIRHILGHAITREDLLPGSAIAEALPLFRIGGDLGRQAEQARVGHNHWVLGTIANDMNQPLGQLETRASEILEGYSTYAASTNTRSAVFLAYQIAEHGWL